MVNNREREEVVVMKKMKEVAEMFEVSTRTIRYYEEIGLLKPQRSISNQRLFSKQEIVKLKLIARGKKYGFSLEEIKEMVLLFDQDRTGKKQLERTIEYGLFRMEDMNERISELQQIKDEMELLLVEFSERLSILEEDTEE